ncbi:MAG: dihydroorotate dehydrogenase electron transfer subunit [Methanoculleaceae archaeon]
MNDGLPEIVEIVRIVEESDTVRTFHFDRSFQFEPGQFVMVWVPGVDEIPMALSSPSSITVQRVGDATRALFQLRKGSRIGIRGPYGNGFNTGGRTLAVAGGVGVAPLLPLAVRDAIDTFLIGARTAGEILFYDTISRHARVMVATDDGTAGRHGPVTELMDMYPLPEYDHICVCGPEPMMVSVLSILDCAGIADRGQFSLHRYMKCGVGICGSCCIDPAGLRVCRDGPVFRGDVLIGSEFGRYRRDAAGRRLPI